MDTNKTLEEVIVESNRNNECVENIEALSKETLRVVSAIKSPNTPQSQQMDESKEAIFKKITNKIGSDFTTYPVKPEKHKLFLPYWRVASIIVLLIASVAALSYFQRDTPPAVDLTQVEIEAPLGTVSRVILSDGTKVTLNSGSKLTYPTSFAGNRQVHLSGEGYFDVAKDENKPFIVCTPNLSVKVLGTRFGFRAYEEDVQTILTLEEGSVSALLLDHDSKKMILLAPDQQLIIDNTTKEFQHLNVNVSDYISWKDGILIFQNQTLSEIVTILERRFGTKIKIRSDIAARHEQYVAQFKYGENVEQILEKLSCKRSWKYIKQDGMIELINRK
jgi:ferric-dicitrate binding protein FerR (iron transport regulator)